MRVRRAIEHRGLPRPFGARKNFLFFIFSRVRFSDKRQILETLNKITLAEQAYQALRHRILNGGLAGGARLQPEELAADMKVSPTPVKEALVRLEAEGLLAGELRRGVSVRCFSTVEIEQLYEARLLVERQAVLVGIEAGRVDARFLRNLRTNHENHIAAFTATPANLGEVLRLDRAFHCRIVDLAANDVLAGWHLRVLEQTHAVRIHSLETYAFERVRTEHAAILKALAARDAPAAANAVATHLSLSRRNLLSRAAEPTRAAKRPRRAGSQ